MQSKTNTFNLALTGMLIAVGIVIPLFSPVKIILEPASFTLASHVAIFIAMFISPQWRLPFLWEPPLDFSWQASR